MIKHSKTPALLCIPIVGCMAYTIMTPAAVAAFPSQPAEKNTWIRENGRWYYGNEKGQYQTGWKKIKGSWYFFDEDGVMYANGLAEIDGKTYGFRSDGVLKTGWMKWRNSWLYLTSDGMLQNTWKKIDGHWYYFRDSGRMTTGWIHVSNDWYYFRSDGMMVTGKRKIDGTTYTFRSDGSLASPSAPASSAYQNQMSPTEFDEKVDQFLADSRWCHGAPYGSSQKAYIGPNGFTACAGYAADFVKFVYGKNMSLNQKDYTSPSRIRSGDVIRLSPGHSIVVLYRDGNRLVTAEGNSNGRVVVSDEAYTVDGNHICFYDLPIFSIDYAQHYLPIA